MSKWGLDIPEQLVDEILQTIYFPGSDKSRAIASAYVNIHPEASWEDLTSRLYSKKEFAAARESKLFKSTGKYWT